MEKLISMTDYVLNECSFGTIQETAENYNKCVNYASFLKQPLNLGMFIPCDEDNNVLDSYFYDSFESGHLVTDEEMEQVNEYEKAKERVLFEGFEFIKKYPNNCIRFKFKGHFRNVFLDKVNIENLICFDKDGMTLSESAKQQLS